MKIKVRTKVLKPYVQTIEYSVDGDKFKTIERTDADGTKSSVEKVLLSVLGIVHPYKISYPPPPYLRAESSYDCFRNYRFPDGKDIPKLQSHLSEYRHLYVDFNLRGVNIPLYSKQTHLHPLALRF